MKPNSTKNTHASCTHFLSTKSGQGHDILLGILYTLATAAAIYIAVIHWVAFFHNNGTGKKPPQSPGKGTNQTQVVSSPLAASRQPLALINTNVGLAAVSFTIQNGVVVSNSAGMNIQPLPSFFSEDGAPVESGGFITNTQPGITVPPSMSVWAETNSYADTNLDPVYPYVAVFNYTVLTSTNLIDWQEAYTVVGWANDNPQVPLQCLITYTNGTPMTTNWEQFYLDSSGQITNIVVYGALPTINTNNTYTSNLVHLNDEPPISPGAQNNDGTRPTVNTNNAYTLNLVHPNGGAPIPPGAGSGGSTNDVPFNSTAQFFRLTCNINDIVTHWP